MALTEKMKAFCHEYIKNGGNGTQAYLASYNWTGGNNGAEVEARTLLSRSDIKEYLQALGKPSKDQAIDEGQKIRQLIWERIDACVASGDDAAIARYTDQLNKLGGRYTNININHNSNAPDLSKLDLTALKDLV